jgi:hypothetical protein
VKIFSNKDTIVRLPSDPKSLEAYFKTLPPEVIEAFAQNALKEGERHEPGEMAKMVRETILRLAWANKYGPTTGTLSDEQLQMLKNTKTSEGTGPSR